jgi:ATP-dependent Clp protease ATP-binding subunit ClpA
MKEVYCIVAEGAHSLRRTIQRLLENPISAGTLRREFTEGETIIVDANSNRQLTPACSCWVPPRSCTNEVLAAQTFY